MKILILLAFSLASAGIAKAQNPPRFVLDPSVDWSKFDLETFNRVIWPAMIQVMTPEDPSPEVTIRLRPGVTAGGNCWPTRHISLGAYPDPSNLNSYNAFVHEMAHAISYCSYPVIGTGLDAFLAEGYATAVTNLTYQKLAEKLPAARSTTALWRGFADNYLPLQVGGGSASFYSNRGGRYANAAAPFELVAQSLGGTLKPVDGAINFAKPRNRAEYLAVVDAVVGKIDGVMPSTIFNQAPSSFTGGPDGTFFGIQTWGSFEPEPNDPAKIEIDAPVNSLMGSVFFFSRQKGEEETLYLGPDTVRWTITHASDSTVLRSGTDNGAKLFWNLPDGGYKLTACVLKSDNTCDQNFSDSTYFARYSRQWTRNKVLVIANSGRPLRIVDAGGATSVEALPDLLVLSNATRDITVTDGVMTRVITPTPISRIVFFKDRDQPFLKAVVNAATFKEGPVVPGSIATLFTWGATHGDPEVSQVTPLPTASCGKRTQVLFTGSDGQTIPAPLFYCSQLQLNVQVPRDLQGPTARVKVRLGETNSNEVEVEVREADPSIFLIDPTTRTGAVIFANGAKAGQLVTRDNPARPGDYLTVYCTGLGETMPPMPGDGIAPPPQPLYTTLRPVAASANGAAWKVLFSGLAPGFVGLYQVNVQVPPDAAPGIYPFTIAVEGRRTSNEILLAVQYR